MPGQEESGEPLEGELDDEDLERSMSLTAIEAELKPKVLETFDNVADAYKRLRRLQDQDIQLKLKSTSLTPHQERKYKKLKEEIEVGQQFSVTRERIRQIEAKALRKLNHPSRSKILRTFLDN
jgi:hypothetical protein